MSLIFLFSIVIYYYSSGLQKLYTPSSLILKVNDKVLKKYVGFDIRYFPTYIKIIKINLLKKFILNNLYLLSQRVLIIYETNIHKYNFL